MPYIITNYCDDLQIKSSEPPKKKAYLWNPEWEVKYLMHSVPTEQRMLCMQCGTSIGQYKTDNIKKHLSRSHESPVEWSNEKKTVYVDKYNANVAHIKKRMDKFVGSGDKLIATATYKLANILGQKKYLFSHADAFVEFAHAGDPDAEVFKHMAKSRYSVTGYTPRHAQTAGDLSFAVQFNAETLCHFALFKATTAYISASTDAGAALAPLLSGRTRVCHWQSA